MDMQMVKRAAARVSAELQRNAPAIGAEMARGLPDPTVTGPCQAQAHWTCTGEAAGERLNPLAMLPDSTVPAGYVPMCQPCYDHLADAFVKEMHA